MRILLIIVSIFFAINLWSVNLTNNDLKVIKIFEKEIQKENNLNCDFEILKNTFAKIKPYGKFKLKKWRIEKLDKNVYKLFLFLKKKKGIFSIKKEIVLYFWYNGNRIIFLTSKGFVKYNFSQNEYEIRKNGKFYIIKKIKIKRNYSFKLKLENNITIYLNLRK